MLSAKEKKQYLSGEKVFTKKGFTGNPLIGLIVKINWDVQSDLLAGISSKEEALGIDKDWVEEEAYVVTGVSNFGIGSTVYLDGKYEVSQFRVYDVKTGEYLATFEEINQPHVHD